MRSTINTKGGSIRIESRPGLVVSNGAELLPHEARLLAFELARAAESGEQEGKRVVATGVRAAVSTTDEAGA